MINARLLAVIIVTFLMSGCSSIPINQTPLPSSALVSAPREMTWHALISQVAMNYPIQAIDKESGLLTTQFVVMPLGNSNSNIIKYTFLPPGTYPLMYSGLRVSLSILAVPAGPESTMLTINSHFEAYDRSSTTWLVLPTNGAIENGVISDVRRELGVD